MKNLLQIANEKKAKLQSTNSVKLTAHKNDSVVVLTEVGVIVPFNELQKFDKGYAYVSGLFASQVSLREALRLNKI
jgi:hypothetical protein